MTKTRSTKRALLTSALVLIMCVAMLIGSTFAWFTDSVSSSNNKIQAGTLELDLEVLKDGNWVSIKDSNAPLFDYNLWEPGYTEAKVLKIENEGSLALKWFAKFTAQKSLSKLAEVIDVYVCPSENELAMPTDRNLAGYTKVGTLDKFINTIEDTTYGTLLAGKEAYLGIVLKMQETAGNEYQGLDLGGEFDITIFATQYTYEKDSFNDQYDVNALFDKVYTATATIAEGESAANLELRLDPKSKLANFVVPAAALEDGEDTITVKIVPDLPYGNITIAANEEAEGFDVSVLGVKENNQEPIKITLPLPEGLDPATVKLYHYDQEIPCVYNPSNGNLTFETADFSPFTVVYDAGSEYVPPVVPENQYPTADVTKMTIAEAEAELGAIQWGGYGQWSPTEGLEANLDNLYKFQCKDSADAAVEGPYANWECDFYVSLDRALGENQIFLGGNYGSFGWVGFHNGDVTLAANEEIPLLGSVTQVPWTYADVASFVGTFYCGAGDVNNALEGATLKVVLRVKDPATGNSYDANTILHTF